MIDSVTAAATMPSVVMLTMLLPRFVPNDPLYRLSRNACPLFIMSYRYILFALVDWFFVMYFVCNFYVK